MKKTLSRSSRARAASRRRETLTKLNLGGAKLSEKDRAADGIVSLSLRSVRLAAGKTQSDVSRVTGIAQGDVCRLEQRESLDECQVSTLRRFVEALGGRLDVKAVFAEGRRVALEGWNDPDS